MKRSKKKRDKRRVPLLPNLITTMALFFGFYSMLFALKENFYKAAIFILFAGFMDALDGRIARATHTTSLFGKEYDSLSDVVAFGVAPAIMVYLWQFSTYGRLGWLASFLFVASGALRLARFNSMPSDNTTFTGLPIPMAAVTLASTVLISKVIGPIPSMLVMIEGYMLSYLMVSNVQYPSFKHVTYIKAHPFQLLVAGVLLLVVIAAFPEIMLFALASTFVLSGPTWGIIRMLRGRRAEGVINEGGNEADTKEDHNL
ncbi:MAG: CDP-diacylglycerol--serine O-phosphatidyltransferase [Deltaproteobacteria bacterium]|nr:CDP-diacylglycerol--serine O-phosphatidyltransferase [Deltaproteobacteria bacterium]